MKKNVKGTLSWVLCLVLIFASVPTFVFAIGSASITIDTSSYSEGINTATVSNVSLPVKVEATNVTVADWTLSYDNTIFESASVSLCRGIEGKLDELNESNAIWWEADNAQNISGEFINVNLVPKSDVKNGDTIISIEGTMTDDEYNDIEVKATATLTIGEVTTSDYTALISTTATDIKVNDNVPVTVTVGGTVGSFASSEVTLTYESTYLTFDLSGSTLNGAGVDTSTKNMIKIVDHGENNTYPAAYVLNFTAKQATGDVTTAVTLTDARFSTAENAISSDLIEATGENALGLSIGEADLKVTLPESGVVTGNTTVPYGKDYIFTAKNTTTYMYYDYEVSATMGRSAVDVKNNGDGTWTIANVTGDLVINVIETPKTYTVTVKGDDTVTAEEIEKVTLNGINDEGKATYNTNLTYTLPDGQAAEGINDGYYYTATVTIGSTAYTATLTDSVYTIEGADVKGDIVITLSKVVEAASSVKVIIEGSNEIQKDGETVNKFTATKYSQVTLTLVPETGYTYKINDGTKDLTINDDNTFTVSVGETDVTITVTKTLDTGSVKVQKYLQLNDTVMWLVTINGNKTTEIDGKTYSYNRQNMFWSSKYQAYCYLVVDKNLTIEDATTKIGKELVTANAIDVEYNMDVNNTSGKVDANDAQLVYNMYQTKAYDSFNAVDMIKFLEADLNDTVGIDTTDAQVIINKLLNVTN